MIYVQKELYLDDLNENPNRLGGPENTICQLAVSQTLNPFAQGRAAPQTIAKFVYNWANYGV